jgi:O-antigen/teichoic acid export membrane protein
VTAGSRRLASAILYTGGAQALNALCGALGTYVVARALGAKDTGAYAGASALLAVLLPLSALGLEVGIPYRVSQRRLSLSDAVLDVRLAALVLGLAASVVGILAWLVVPAAFGHLELRLVILVVAALPFALLWGLTGVIALSVGRYAVAAWPPSAYAVLALLLTITLTLTDGLAGSLIAITAAQATVAAATVVWARRWRRQKHTGRAPRLAASARRLVDAARFGFPVYVFRATQVLSDRLDLFLVIGFAGAAAGGRYGVALSLTAALLLLPRAVGMVLVPSLAELARSEAAETEQLAAESRALRHLVIVNLAAGAAMALCLVFLVPVLYGSQFAQTTVLGLILIPGMAARGLAEALSSSLAGRARHECGRRVTSVVTPSTIALYLAIIPTLHAIGAAVASTCAYSLSLLMWARFYRREITPHLAAVITPSRKELREYRALLNSLGRASRQRVAHPRSAR